MKEINFTHSYNNASRVARAMRDLDDDRILDCLDQSSSDFLNRISKPCKNSLLHDLIRCEIFNAYEWAAGKYPQESVQEFAVALEDSGIDLPQWLNEDEIYDHGEEMNLLLKVVIENEVEATFHLLFTDRNFLYQFQSAVSEDVIREMRKSDHPQIMKRDGVLKRATYIPGWLKSAVFHRDKGRCQICWRDLTGLLVPINDLELDHMVPLASSGTNDATNFQLICGKCNREKSSESIVQPHKIAPYW